MRLKNFIFSAALAALSFSVSFAQEPSKVKEIEVNGVKFNMVEVEGGMFHMTESFLVTLDTYYIGQTEVTQELWQAVMKKNPSESQDPKFPVESVSWSNCQKFIKKLNQLTGMKFRLPTEAEWVYAAIGGKKSRGYVFSGSNKLDEVGWHKNHPDSYVKFIEQKGNKRVVGDSHVGYLHQVATLKPNELGIYDMSGNVSEWCQDVFKEKLPVNKSATNPTGPEQGELRVFRGGGYNSIEENCLISYRFNSVPYFSFNDLGLRLVLEQ